MKKTAITVAICASFLLLSGGGKATASTTTPLLNRSEFTVGQGDLLTSFKIDPRLIRGDQSSEVIVIQLGGNYFLTDIFAPGLEVEYGRAARVDSFRLLPNLRAYWPLNRRWLPYAMIGIGYAYADGSNLFDFAIGPGIDFMLSNTVAIGFQFRYDLGVGGATIHEIRFPIGFALYFKI